MIYLAEVFAISLLGCFCGAFLGHLIADFLSKGAKEELKSVKIAEDAKTIRGIVNENDGYDKIHYLLYKNDGKQDDDGK